MAEEIWHHGIKGQKWGVRHTPEQFGHKTHSNKAAKKDNSYEDYKKAHDSKSVKSMSDAGLLCQQLQDLLKWYCKRFSGS